MLEGSIDKRDSRKKLFVVPESRNARKGRRTPATCKLTIMRRESPLVVVAFNRARSTGGLEGWAATGGPGPPSKPVGRPAPTGPCRFLDDQVVQHPRDARLLLASISALARGTQPRDVLAFDKESKPFDARFERRPCSRPHVFGHPTTRSRQPPSVLGRKAGRM